MATSAPPPTASVAATAAVPPPPAVAPSSDKGPSFSRVFHAPKLERKQSTGDLLSRLKTRKVLGVGETENGDVHRSKISQLLGHNEHLYMKLPRGWWAWHFAMATCLTAEGALLFFFPSTARQILFPSLVASLTAASGPIEAEASAEINLQLSTAHQCHGAALLGLAFLLWKFFHSKDRAEARATTSAVGMYHFLLAWAVLIGSVRTRGFESLWQADCYVTFGIRTTVAIISAVFNKWIGSSSSAAGKTA